MLKTILVAVDGSEHAKKAARLAGDFAGRYEAELVIAHVLVNRKIPDSLRRMAEIEHLVEPEPPKSLGPGILSTAPEDDLDAKIIAALGEKIMGDAEVIAREAGARKVSKMALTGEPADALLEEAKRVNADLVVMGTRGMGDLGALLLGSVSHKVIQLAECPVTVVK